MDKLLRFLLGSIRTTEQEQIEQLKKENEKLKKELHREKESHNSGWEFYYNGHGDYEEQRRCFYGEFS